MFDALTVVSNDGSVIYIPQVERKVKCSRDGSTFTCTFKYGSWVYDGFKVRRDMVLSNSFYTNILEYILLAENIGTMLQVSQCHCHSTW